MANANGTVVAKDGVVVGPTAPDATAKCSRCGRTFPAKFVYCVCKG